MLKKDIVKKVSDNLGINVDDVSFVFDEIVNEVSNAISDGHNLQFRGLGSFVIYETKERSRLNVSTGEIEVSGKNKRVKFVPGKKIKKSFGIK